MDFSNIYIAEPPMMNMPETWLACVPFSPYSYEEVYINPNLDSVNKNFVEDNLVEILVHEQIHQILCDIEGDETSRGFDKIFTFNLAPNDCKGERMNKINFIKEMLE
jgi:hypothetical protein